MSDSGIVQVSFNPSTSNPTQNVYYVYFYGMKIGTTIITIQDSAKTGSVDITVSVAVLVASPSAVSVKRQQTKYVYLSGGTYPYSISTSSNPAIATVTISSSSLTVTGIAQGATSVTINDAANPVHSVTIPITVTIPEKFTTAGKMSMSSSAGNLDVNGIYSGDNPDVMPSNDAGAGGFITKSFSSGNFCQVIGYRMKSATQVDLVAMLFNKFALSPGSVTLDSSRTNPAGEYGLILMGFDAVPYSETNKLYSTFSGSISVSMLTEKKAEGTFSGTAAVISNTTGNLTPGSNVSITNGVFSVPVITQESSSSTNVQQEERLFQQIERMVQPYFDRAKKQMEANRLPTKRQ